MPKTYSSVPGNERMEDVPCPVCGSARRRPFLACDGFSFVKCRDCSIVYQNPRPVFEDVRERYGADYFSYELQNERNFYGLMRLGLGDVRFSERTARFGQDGAPPRTFLDIGCATGMLIESMRGEGWSVRGVDVCRESAEHGRKLRGVEIFAGTLEEARISDGTFGAIHFSHLIEHVPDPRAFLKEVHRILAPGGCAAITTPNVDGFQARLFGKNWRSAIADHLVLFSRRTLVRLIEEEGFEIERTVTWGGLAVGTAPKIVKFPIDRMAKRFGFGDVVMVLATKRKVSSQN
jgi:2-polyprenyl-3-methyl-5-hydroxy-6-metoxy-1,4-benzoquinol methylase